MPGKPGKAKDACTWTLRGSSHYGSGSSVWEQQRIQFARWWTYNDLPCGI